MKIYLASIVTLCLIHFAAGQSPSPTPSGPHSNSPSSSGSGCQPDPQAVQQHVSYNASAPDCGTPTVTVQTLTNPFSEPSFIIINFTVDDDILINGEVYQTPGSDFSFHDTGRNPCPDANGTHTDQYLGVLSAGESITLGVKNNFRGFISLEADVYFNPPGSSPDCVRPTDDDDTKDDDDNTDCGGGGPMARYFFHLMLASLHIEDTPIAYKAGRGPDIEFKVAYNEREANQPELFDYSNFGSRWTFNWLSYVTDDPSNPSANASVYVRGGGTEVYSGFDSPTQSYAPDPQSQAVLVRTDSGLYYEKRFRDGSKEVFRASDAMTSYPRRVFLTSIVDPSGNAVTLGYESGFRLSTITDALGKTTTLSYENTDDSLKITKVTDPFGRVAQFDYTDGELSQITDPVGIQSQFFYEAGDDFINKMHTPYGDTVFAHGENGDVQRWVEATDPLLGKERVEYDAITGLAATDLNPPQGVENSNLNQQVTFFWDKKAMADAPGDYNMARMTKWLHLQDGTTVSGIKHSEKRPLENRVWYTYPGQPDGATIGTSAFPARVARILDDGSEQDWQYTYNSLGNMTKKVDPVGRVTSYDYDDNGIDLLTAFQRNSTGTGTDPDGANADITASYTYNSQHLPLTLTDAALETTHYGYNSFGQVATIENPKHEVTTYGYGDGSAANVPIGYLGSITGPSFGGNSAVTSFTYDCLPSDPCGPANRVRTVTTSPDAYVVTTDYDNIDRPTQITYPDNTTRQFQYSQDFGNGLTTIVDLSASKDRDGRWTTRHYDANRHVDSITDPLNQTTLYGWCKCGALESITDPNGNITSFIRDIQSRVQFKVFGDASQLYNATTISYNYESSTSRLREMFNENNGQDIEYSYFADDNIAEIDYLNAFSDPTLAATPNVTFVYDSAYNRIKSMSDGIGTTNYVYYSVGVLGGNKLHQTSGPLPNSSITYGYDELGRIVSQDINGSSSSVHYDPLDRVDNTTNVLGSFGRSYDGVTARLQTLNYPNGQTASFTYFGNASDRRLQTLQNIAPGSLNLSRHDYTYDPEGQIQTWNKILGTTETDLSFAYDDAKQLLSATRTGLALNYSYDLAGNRLGDDFSASHHVRGGSDYTANNLNQLDSVLTNSGFGPSNTIPVPITYDANGNMLYDGANKTFEWDLANRMAAINYLDTGGRTEFAYDGLGRRVKITEYTGVTGATVQPDGSDYQTFTSEPFTIAGGNYTLIFQGLNPNGGYNVILLDAVMLTDSLVPNGSFESPVLNDGAVAYGGGGDTIWNYTANNTGIATAGSFLTASNRSVPDGNQVGFIETVGALQQTLSVPAGTYTLSFAAAQNTNANDTYQQVRVTLRGSSAASVKAFVWCGNRICEERDATGSTTTKRYFAEGEQRVGGADAGNYYYSRDHLGSVREVTDSNGNLVARFDYDPWGKESVTAGNMNFDFGFTGHYFHQPSGLNLSPNRAYSSALGRWITRDLLKNAELSQGPNLYGYVANDPVNLADALGLYYYPLLSRRDAGFVS